MLKVYVGWDPRETPAYKVCLRSLLGHSSIRPMPVEPLLLSHLQGLGLYTRPVERRGGRLWDPISEAPMATEFAISRFFVPALANGAGWALFCDADFLWRADVAELLELADPRFAVMVVKHDHAPDETTKMDGQLQTLYARKNWSSLVLWNCAHPAQRALDDAALNGWPGRDLHAFKWLHDDLIGALPEAWNWLEGHSDPAIEPGAVHFTRGTPDMPGHEDVPYGDEWRAVLADIA